MAASPDLYFLPAVPEDWRMRLRALAAAQASPEAWAESIALAGFALNFTQASALDTIVHRLFTTVPADLLSTAPERLAVLSSATMTHLLPSLRVSALRRGIWLDTWENDYGLYHQAVLDRDTPLEGFAPTAVLFSLDAEHTTRGIGACRALTEAEQQKESLLAMLEALWARSVERFGAQVLQQTLLPRLPETLGGNEHCNPGSAAAHLRAINEALRPRTAAAGVGLVALDARAATDGLAAWFNPALWFKSKQEINPAAAPMFGELPLRQIAARKGKVAKCCVLDLDNTLWGGVVGDHGINGIIVGQGSAEAESFSAIQAYAASLRRRGILLAVCSKNDESVARRAFEENPNMTLKAGDFASFVANWEDKPSNLRRIARELNIGLDSLVFVDDNPFERDLVRQTLPMVFVPELPEEPALIPAALSDAGCFESLALTAEDFDRAGLYAPERRMPDLTDPSTDLPAYLASLGMTMKWGNVDDASRARVTQLINKTNQFNVTTRRYTEAQVKAMEADETGFCLHFRLLDRFGDNGLIGVVIGRLGAAATIEIDSWLMSCRVLGRHVEEAMLNVVVAEAAARHARKVVGVYLPTERNGMVAELYPRLGFAPLSADETGRTFVLELDAFTPHTPPIQAVRIA
ncbi:HAD-IIIC family phosphatase [Shinella sp. G-2]|uniref:HAD-IIIC family phosphatase n=1 Tax=Shinella sp. G-2 TaxID=3133141 RepID=UPI003CFE32FB